MHRDINPKISEMDSTIELDDSSSVGERTIVLDSTNEESKKNETIDLDSTNDDHDEDEQNGNEEDLFTTAASNTNFLDSPPKITSTPNIQLFSTPSQHPSNSMFHEVEDEFAHDDSFGDEVTKTPIDNKEQTSKVSPSTETPVGNQRQISSDHEQSEESDSEETDDSHDESVDDNDQYQRINDDSEEEEDDDEGVEDEEEKEKSFVDQMTQRPNMENPELPSTCTMITTPQGAKVFIVGTAHFSRQSHDDVSTIMKQFLPDVVVLELCKSRTNILSLDEETLLAESESLDTNKVMQILKEYGGVQGLMYILLLSMSASLTKTLGMAPGGEFRRAFHEAQSIPGCVVHLGDRPIQVTLKRALATLTTWQKIKLAFNILTSSDKITPEDVEKMKEKDLLESLLEEMAGEYPAMSRVFVEERDSYLAYSLKQASETPIHDATKAREPRVVVGVVGLGHMSGIVQKFNTVTSEEVSKVMVVPPPSKSSKYVRFALKMGFWSLTAYGAYRMVRRRLL